MEAIEKSQLASLFENKSRDLLSVYFTAGYPDLASTNQILEGLEAAGADIAEVGMPYSDPLADGPVIQESGSKALSNGMNLRFLFEQLSQRESSIPIILMGYLNPVLQFGMEDFLKQCQACRVSALILPDLPLPVYERQYRSLFEKYGIGYIGLITPQSSEERIRKIDKASSGFIYAVSSASTTGSAKTLDDAVPYLDCLQKMKLQNPVLTGFTIRDEKSFSLACSHSQGAIVGSAFIRHLSEKGSSKESIAAFVKHLKGSEK